MSLIDRKTLPTQLQSVLSGLNYPNEKLTRLTTLLKTTTLSGIDSVELNSYFENLTNYDGDLTKLSLLIFSSRILSPDMMLSVESLYDLDDYAVSAGSVFYVESEGAPYIKKRDGSWVLIAPSLQPKVLKLFAWGANYNGQLGDGTTSSKVSPTGITAGILDWKDSSSGELHSIGLRANGTLWAWGNNSSGRLGDGSTVARSRPVEIVGGFADWISASAGSSHSIGLRSDGTLWSWGNNLNGRLGDNTVTNRSSPVSVVGGFTNWVSASAGGTHSLGVRANGTMRAWGSNNFGQLGDGTNANRSSTVLVVGGIVDWISASAGGSHSLGLRANGTLRAWGLNVDGRLGDNTVVSKISPALVVGGFTDWISASAGGTHSLGVRASGTIWAWGNNDSGKLGDNSTVNRSSPVSVVGGFTDWIGASAGGDHSIGLRANGTLWAWGNNGNGRLGDNTTINTSSPVIVTGGFTNWISVSAGGEHSLGVRTG